MSAGADFSTVLKIQQNNDSVKRQVSFFCSASRPKVCADWTETADNTDK